MKAAPMRMPWRAIDNVTDYRIFCIRLMESYFDQMDKWECDFKKNEVSLQKCLEINIIH